ncbi:MAG TPA: hypothetical protein ENK82_05350 [Campylobacterales bacterium]|nr:hypothetical protein [Campylobacterales bacterium]HHS92752.1 hypothetical protein [Campylobacterales bacterium]
MKTFNTIFLTTILLSSSLYSADKLYSFIGIQAGSASVKKDTVPSIGLKYGKQTKKYRTTLSYAYGETSNTKYDTLIAQIDMGILSNTFKNSSFKPYAGISFGVIQANDKLTGETDKGYLYGPNGGISYIFNDTLDLDLGYRYLKTSKLKNIDTMHDVSLSLHYFY